MRQARHRMNDMVRVFSVSHRRLRYRLFIPKEELKMTVLLQDNLLEPCQRAKDWPSSDLSRRSMADGTTKHHLGCCPSDPMDPVNVAKAFCRWRFVRKGKNRKETTFLATVGVAQKKQGVRQQAHALRPSAGCICCSHISFEAGVR